MKRKQFFMVLFSCCILLTFFLYYRSYKKISNPVIVSETSPADMVTNNSKDTLNASNDSINGSNDTSNALKDITNASNDSKDTSFDTINSNINEVTDTLAISDPNLITETINQLPTKESLRLLPSGTILKMDDLGDNITQICFYQEEITEDIKSRINGKSYGEDCTVPLDNLRYVRVLYYGFDDRTHIGELVVNTVIAEDIIDIFIDLYEMKYPIEQMVLVDDYDADDNASMAANNTSSFNYRTIPDSNHLSKHSLGLAIDINPLYNPYVKYNDSETIVLPEEGTQYADRSLECSYYIRENDPCYEAFIKRGFTWGGFWKTSPDYQHFQKDIE